MNRNVVTHTIILLFSILGTFFWVRDPRLNYYSLQATAIMLMLLIARNHLGKPSKFRLLESVTSTIAVLLVTTSTGGIKSPLFFINYLLLFELSLFLEPIIPVLTTFAFVLFYFFIQIQFQYNSLIGLSSLLLMTPLAYFMGLIYRKASNQKKMIQNDGVLPHEIES